MTPQVLCVGLGSWDKKDIKLLECVQGKATSMVKGLKDKGSGWGLEKRLRGGPIIVYNFPKDSSGVGGANLLSGDQQWDARKWNGAASGVLLMGPFQLELFFDSKVLLGWPHIWLS